MSVDSNLRKKSIYLSETKTTLLGVQSGRASKSKGIKIVQPT